MSNRAKETKELQQRSEQAVKITWIGFWVNMLLSIGKILVGIFGKSAAMLADGIHSLSDFITDFIVIAFIKISSKDNDRDHQYGHGKFETLATMLISVALMIVGAILLYNGAKEIIKAVKGSELTEPSYWAIVAAIVSIGVKEWLYRITVITGKKIKSDAVIANAWHHRSDALSSIGTLIGISGAVFLGKNWRILDPIASLIVSVFIIKVGFNLLLPALQELLEKALPEDVEKQIADIIENTDGVITYHHLKTRKSGSIYIIDVHIKVEPTITVVAGHNIATSVENSFRNSFGQRTQSSIHIEPYIQKQTD